MTTLPDFNTNPTNTKHIPLDDAAVKAKSVQPVVIRLLEQTAARLGKPKNELRVLDYGCGRGNTVAALRNMGYNAFGVDIDPIYVANGSHYFREVKAEYPIISTIAANSVTLFPAQYFDVVLSDQVLEHVKPIELVMNEINRISSDNAVGLHIYPSVFSLIEPHMFLPCVHWLPKNALRKKAIHLLLALGLGAPYFKDYTTTQRTEIFYQFSVSDTYYRGVGTISALFNSRNFKTTCAVISKFLNRGGMAAKLISLPIVGGLLARMYSLFHQDYVLTSRTQEGLSNI